MNCRGRGARIASNDLKESSAQSRLLAPVAPVSVGTSFVPDTTRVSKQHPSVNLRGSPSSSRAPKKHGCAAASRASWRSALPEPRGARSS
jgi:hypothetical protein